MIQAKDNYMMIPFSLLLRTLTEKEAEIQLIWFLGETVPGREVKTNTVTRGGFPVAMTCFHLSATYEKNVYTMKAT